MWNTLMLIRGFNLNRRTHALFVLHMHAECFTELKNRWIRISNVYAITFILEDKFHSSRKKAIEEKLSYCDARQIKYVCYGFTLGWPPCLLMLLYCLSCLLFILESNTCIHILMKQGSSSMLSLVALKIEKLFDIWEVPVRFIAK